MLSVALSLLGIGKNVMAWLTGAVRWLFQAWYRIAIAALLMVGVYLFLANVSLRKQVTHWKERYTVEATAHITTKVGYANAQKVAADMNKKQVERIESEYAAIADKSEKNYDALLADSRGNLAAWMRRAKAVEGSANRAGTGGTAEVQPEATGTGEMPDVSGGVAIVPVSDLELVAGAYAKLAALQDAAKAVEGVSTE